MIFWGILTFASILSNAEARMTDVNFEEGESTSSPLARPETKREEKKQEALTSLKDEESGSTENLLPLGESSKTDREGKTLGQSTSPQEEESDSNENSLSSGESSESSQEERKREDLTSLEEENDSTENLFPPSESSDPAGGGLRQLDQKYLSPDVPQPAPSLPWWERWYLTVKQWILGA
jgi:hypothetical protein